MKFSEAMDHYEEGKTIQRIRPDKDGRPELIKLNIEDDNIFTLTRADFNADNWTVVYKRFHEHILNDLWEALSAYRSNRFDHRALKSVYSFVAELVDFDEPGVRSKARILAELKNNLEYLNYSMNFAAPCDRKMFERAREIVEELYRFSENLKWCVTPIEIKDSREED